MSAITLVTVQNTKTVSRVELLGTGLVMEQIQAVNSDIPPNAIKTGALGSAEIIRTVAEAVRGFDAPLVVDPVMVSKHGLSLLKPDAVETLIQELLPQAFLITPNIPEAELLAGMKIRNQEEMLKAGEKLLALGAKNILIKGGHLEGSALDLLFSAKSHSFFDTPRQETLNTHGTGCVLSAAITAGLAKGVGLKEAVEGAKSFVTEAIRTNPKLGHGVGPVNLWATTP